MSTRPSQWIIRVTFVDGESRYYGGFMRQPEWVRTRGSAGRYESEIDALYHAYKLKESYGRIDDVEVEEIVNPRKSSKPQP